MNTLLKFVATYGLGSAFAAAIYVYGQCILAVVSISQPGLF